ncbi:MAG: DUF1549 and DUF1553 domain-containing protein [Gemmataceae bacterium]|nr:DUF1549 and DUF1553 domain-containing protein [Gemmataceae bacterium]
MLRVRQVLLFLLLVFASRSVIGADEPPPAEKPIGNVVDHFIDLKLKQENITPAPQADDATFIRRLTLDLVGRIPTAAETKAFVESTDPEKRVRLIDRLMASPGFVRHQATEFDTMLMYGTQASIRDYLVQALTENRPWDRIFREVLLPEETDAKQKVAGEFVRKRVNDLDRLTNDVSVVFFGVNISCAQCHDHPKVEDWKQDHFFGMKAFFSRTFDNGGFLAEREAGVVKFRTTEGKDRQARLMFLSGKAIDDASVREMTADEAKKEKDRFEASKKAKTPPPKPTFSARAQLVEMALQPEQREFFARSIVNRIWHRLYGQGLVMPLDQMHSKNPPSHPELLEWLARDTAEHNYDLRRLIRGLVLSKAYSRSSRWQGEDAPAPRLFAVGAVRPLTPMQMAASLQIATAAPGSFPALEKNEEFEKRIENMEASVRGFASSIEQPRDNFQIGVGEALLFSNSDRLQKQFLGDAGDRLLGALKVIKDEKELVEVAVRNIYARNPTEEEIRVLIAYLQKRQDRPIEASRQMLWALLASTEFRFNH